MSRSCKYIQTGEFCYRDGRRLEAIEPAGEDGKVKVRDESGKEYRYSWIYLTWTTRPRRTKEKAPAAPAAPPPSLPAGGDQRPFDVETTLKDWAATVREPWPSTPDDPDVRKICIVGFDLNGDVRRACTIEQSYARQFLLEEGFTEAERWRWTKTGWFEPMRAALYWHAYVQEVELSPVDELRSQEAAATDDTVSPAAAVEEVLA